MKKSIKKKQEYGGLEKKKQVTINPLDRPLAIEGSKGPLAITGILQKKIRKQKEN